MSLSENSLSLSDQKIAIGRMKNTKVENDLFLTGSFTWRIEGFSKLNNDNMYYSDVFVIGGLKWQILLHPKVHASLAETESFSLYLGVADVSTLPPGWATCAHFRLTMVNQLDTKKSISKPAKGTVRLGFKKGSSEWGFRSFMPCSELYDCSAGYLVNDICIVEAKVDIPIKSQDHGSGISATIKSSIKKEQKWLEPSNVNSVQVPDSLVAPKTPCSELVPALQDTPGSGKALTVNPTNDSPVEPSLNKVPMEVPTDLPGEHVDFKGFGRIERVFLPLLEEVCSWHPSLIQCQLKSSNLFANSAFNALGRVLYFLKTTKVKDMTQESCERLQLFWEELETFRFDLGWLEPRVQYALGVKRLVQRAGRRKRLREDVDDLENEIKRRKHNVVVLEAEVQRQRATLAVAEVDLQVAKVDLAKVEEDFNGIDMDSEMGYERP
ncbi:MATH domain and coiled-coil domain-containing protein At3g58270-like isoform X2 [Prunus avium]|uniref:MATH domain and coiled-coil domain-containing protein At3g58270-like isoform X2 n=1 Tax=Prunus avium TaxID=42229 RepID=A0A6P5T5Y9_PRUAV|nr:MATH domain and coiled-coil domain-containing protein At3g58270-like isoform X2 [Prunus avium]